MSLINFLLVTMLMTLAAGQRPSFAGSRPIGYPEVIKPTTEGLGNRFGEDDEGTTIRLPIEANGDRDLVERLSKLPVDQQPFWFINWQAYEAQRKNPQTYPQRPSPFNENMGGAAQNQFAQNTSQNQFNTNPLSNRNAEEPLAIQNQNQKPISSNSAQELVNRGNFEVNRNKPQYGKDNSGVYYPEPQTNRRTPHY